MREIKHLLVLCHLFSGRPSNWSSQVVMYEHLFYSQGHMMLPTERELDVPLTPQTSQSRVNVPTFELQKEELSPLTGR